MLAERTSGNLLTPLILFSILGYIIDSDDRFLSAIRRDRRPLFAGGVMGLLAQGRPSGVFGDQAFEWALTFVVQWDAGIRPKLLVVVIGSFLSTLGLIELLIGPFKAMRMLFGMKPRGRKVVQA